jgi:hypothetical protein
MTEAQAISGLLSWSGAPETGERVHEAHKVPIRKVRHVRKKSQGQSSPSWYIAAFRLTDKNQPLGDTKRALPTSLRAASLDGVAQKSTRSSHDFSVAAATDLPLRDVRSDHRRRENAARRHNISRQYDANRENAAFMRVLASRWETRTRETSNGWHNQQLAQMGALLTIVGVPGTPNAGQPLNIGLQPALQPLTFTDIVLENLSLDFIAKQDVFTNKDITQPGFVEDPAITKILPLFDLAAVPQSLDSANQLPEFLRSSLIEIRAFSRNIPTKSSASTHRGWEVIWVRIRWLRASWRGLWQRRVRFNPDNYRAGKLSDGAVGNLVLLITNQLDKKPTVSAMKTT